MRSSRISRSTTVCWGAGAAPTAGPPAGTPRVSMSVRRWRGAKTTMAIAQPESVRVLEVVTDIDIGESVLVYVANSSSEAEIAQGVG